MALFENVPYVNFHEMNLDWILKFIQETRNKLDQIEAAVIAAQAAQAGAETARAGAEDAQAAAEAAAEEAAGSAANAETEAQAAEDAKNAAQAAQSSASGSAAQAQQSATAAGNSATQAAQSAAAAAQNSNAAAQSASSAAQSAGTATTAAQTATTQATAAAASAAEAAESAGSVPDIEHFQLICAENIYQVLVSDPLIVKSHSEIANPGGLTNDFSGMIEFSFKWPHDSTSREIELTSTDFGDFITIDPDYVWGLESRVISARPLYSFDAERYDLVFMGNGNIGSFYDSAGKYHYMCRVWDRTTGTWAADGVSISGILCFIAAPRAVNAGSANNGVHA